jgi:hypothetical protein
MSYIFWDIRPCSSLKVNRRFVGICGPSSSGSKNKAEQGTSVARRAICFHAGFLLRLFLDHKDVGDELLRNVGFDFQQTTLL